MNIPQQLRYYYVSGISYFIIMLMFNLNQSLILVTFLKSNQHKENGGCGTDKFSLYRANWVLERLYHQTWK